MTRAAALSLVVLSACAGTGTHPTPHDGRGTARLATAAPAESVPRPLSRRAALTYEIRGRPFPLPLVTGTFAGQEVRMLVDTGANSHVIAGWFARKAGLTMKKLGDLGSDHVGKSIATYRIDKLSMEIQGWGKLSATTFLATEVPDVIEKLGIAAFVSPQRLDEEGDAVVVDLAQGEMRSAWWSEAKDTLTQGGVPLIEKDVARICEDDDGPVRGLAFVVPATIDSQHVQLLVDTGAQHSDVFASSAAGQALASQSVANKEPMYTASGKVSPRRLSGAHLATGTLTVTTDIDLIQGAADTTCPRDGVLAMDVLRACTLVLGRKRMLGRCAPGK
jgi:predicted aspartyl protease